MMKNSAETIGGMIDKQKNIYDGLEKSSIFAALKK